MMKRRVRLAAAVFALAVAAWPLAGADRAADRVLVLGFRSDFLDDIQDRCFREMLIRRFHENGFAVVPVMEIESLLQTERPPDIRNVDARIAAELCAELGAGFAICGKINRVLIKGKGGADSYEYVCEAAVFSMREQTFGRTTVSGPFAGDMEQFLNGLAAEVAVRLKSRIRP